MGDAGVDRGRTDGEDGPGRLRRRRTLRPHVQTVCTETVENAFRATLLLLTVVTEAQNRVQFERGMGFSIGAWSVQRFMLARVWLASERLRCFACEWFGQAKPFQLF